MCIPRYKGEGYSEQFCKNLEKVKYSLKDDNYILVDGCDDLCVYCPNNIDGKCTDENKVNKYDKFVKERINQGKSFSLKIFVLIVAGFIFVGILMYKIYLHHNIDFMQKLWYTTCN